MRSLLDRSNSHNVYFFLHISQRKPERHCHCSQYEIMFFWTLRLRVCLQNWTDSVLHSPGCSPPELIQNPVDLSQRKSSTVSGVQSLLPHSRSETPSLTAATTVPQRPDMVFPDPRVLCVAVFYLHCLLCLI